VADINRNVFLAIAIYASPGKEGFYQAHGFRKMKTGMAHFREGVAMRERGLKNPAANCRECSALRQCFAATVRKLTIFWIRSLTFIRLWRAAAPLNGISARLRQATGNALAGAVHGINGRISMEPWIGF